MSDDNVFADEWDPGDDWSGGGARSKRLPRGEHLGATVYELGPGTWVPLHFQPRLGGAPGGAGRPADAPGADGSRQLEPGAVVHFPTGPVGVHALSNETDEPVRYLIASTLHSPEVAEYPDLKQITVQARTGSQTGERLWLIHDVPENPG